MSDGICEQSDVQIFRAWIADAYGASAASHFDDVLARQMQDVTKADLMYLLQDALDLASPHAAAIDEAIRAEPFLSD
jgi:hypothetical protein